VRNCENIYQVWWWKLDLLDCYRVDSSCWKTHTHSSCDIWRGQIPSEKV